MQYAFLMTLRNQDYRQAIEDYILTTTEGV